MPVFFVYVHDGGTYSMDDMECSPNAEVVRRELASRVRTGKGKSRFVRDMDEISSKAAYGLRTDEEWPPATATACMAVWRVRGWDVPTGQPDEVWQFSGNVDRPTIIPATLPKKDPVPTSDMRVPEDVFQRRVKMGWDAHRARTTPFGHRMGSVRAPLASSMRNNGDDVEGSATYTGRPSEVFTAFGMTRSIAEWHDMTGIGLSALRQGARRHGLEEYLRKKQWHPRWGMP